MTGRNRKIPDKDKVAKALSDIRTNKWSVRKAASTYGIAKSTLYDRLSGKTAENSAKLGPDTYLSLEEERQITEWAINLCKCGFPLKKDDLLNTVQKIVKDIGRKTPFKDNRPGKTWLKLFLKRHPMLVKREAESISKARAVVTEDTIRSWFMELKEYLTNIGQEDVMQDPSRIFNGDETSFSLCPKTGKVMAPKGYKNVYQITTASEKETITVLITMSAAGKTVPPMVIFPYVRPPKDIVSSMPDSWFLGRTESGWMRSETFYEYVANCMDSWLTEHNVKRPVIFFVDGHKSHLTLDLSEFCDKRQIILYALPPNTTHILQPADVSLFKPLKENWKNTVRSWQNDNVGQVLTKKNFCTLLQMVLENYENYTTTIENGFRKCGLYPLDPNAVDYSKCVKTNTINLAEIAQPPSTLNKYKFASEVIMELSSKLRDHGIDPDIILKLISESSGNAECISNGRLRTQIEMLNIVENTPCAVEDSTPNVPSHNLSTISLLDVSLDNIEIPSGEFVVNDEGILELADEQTLGNNEADSNNEQAGSLASGFSSSNISASTSNAISTHLFYPKPVGFVGKRCKEGAFRPPSAISSKGWREIYEQKEQEKQLKQEAVLQRKEERLAKKNLKKSKGRVKTAK